MRLKYALIFLFLVMLSSNATAKHKGHRSSKSKSSWQNSVDMSYGIAAGVTYPYLVVDGNDAEVSSNPGYKIGIMWCVDVGKIDFTAEMWYSSVKLNFDKDNAGLTGAELKSNTLDLPLLAGFDLTRRLKLQMGPTFSIMSNNSLTLKNGDYYEFGSIKSNVGYVAGLSYNIFSNFILDLRYSGRFATSSSEFYSNTEPYKMRMSTIDITAGFKF